jgi:hypothetical protein
MIEAHAAVTLMAFMIDDDNDILCKADEVKSKKLI